MERDHAALNRVRTAFSKRVGAERMPASTGIQGGVYPGDRGGARICTLTVTCQHRTMAYVSGTASIDEQGRAVHVGDIGGQAHRMPLNVEQLLAGSGDQPGDIARATSFLRHAEPFAWLDPRPRRRARFAPALLALAVCLGPRTATPADVPYRDFSGQGAQFHGPGRQDEAPDTLTAVRVGLVGPGQGAAGHDLRHGV